ncbi:hypothetical protein [Kribbella sp. NPDC049227]|uniref:hypothetical protein n=1 Tax=Kribbella sp. NPDC049227 TaxID=3364113 RepID=UPI00371F2F3C
MRATAVRTVFARCLPWASIRLTASWSSYPVPKRSDVHDRRAHVWDVPTQVAWPCATQNVLDESDTRTLIRNGCIAVGEGGAIGLFQDAGSPSHPTTR